jgi:hypothetical protein
LCTPRWRFEKKSSAALICKSIGEKLPFQNGDEGPVKNSVRERWRTV